VKKEMIGYFLVLCAILASCNESSGPVGENDKEGTYVNFALNGPRENGVYTIEVTPNSNIFEHNMLVSTSTFSKGTFGLGDSDTKQSVILNFPVKEGLFELNDLNDMYHMTITVNDRVFHAKTVSVHITHLKKNKYNPMKLAFFKGRFEGVMDFFYTEDRVEKWEDYTVYGDFQYTDTSY